MPHLRDPVERQADAYNRRNIAFLACYDPDTVIEDATGTVVMRGHEVDADLVRRPSSANPAAARGDATRIRVGDYIVDEERITGRRGSGDEVRVVVIYHVANDLIDHVRLIR